MTTTTDVTYAWAPGVRYAGNAQDVKAELDQIAAGEDLTPEAVMAAARPKDSALHHLIFDVRPTHAAHLYYRQRAQGLLRAIVEVRAGEVTTIRPFVRIVTEGVGTTYERIELPDVRAVEIARLRQLMGRVRQMLRDLEVYPDVGVALDRVLIDELSGVTL